MTAGHYTPGPWRAEGETVKAVSHGQWFKITRADGLRHTKEGNEDNARLIAAAPELLEALKAVLEHGSLDPSHLHKFGKAYQQAEFAIAKAEGR